MSQPLLEVKNLRVSYRTYAGEVQAVRGLSFSMERGETLAVVGESGCGKSVSAKALMGLINCPPGEIKPGSQVLFEGKNVLDFTPAEWSAFRGKECAMIFQDALAALNPTVTVGRQIAENLTVHHMAGRSEAMARAVEMLSLVGISQPEKRARQYPHEFSGGMRQRAMIAMALACGPKLLIADEPTTALDVTIQAQILNLIKELNRRLDMTTILITHDLGVVATLCDKVAVMYGGLIMEDASADDIFYHPQHPYTMGLIDSIPRVTGGAKQRLKPIPGTPPNLINPPKGCPFSARCPYCMNVCQEELPPYFTDGEHRTMCWLLHDEAPANPDYEKRKGGTRRVDG